MRLKSLHNGNIGPTKPVKELYEQRLVYQNPISYHGKIFYCHH